MDKKVQVVMLPTQNSSMLTYYPDVNQLSLAHGSHYGIPESILVQHLYVISGDPINIGDVTYHPVFGLGNIVRLHGRF